MSQGSVVEQDPSGRQRVLYQRLWSLRGDGAASPDLLRHEYWARHLRGRVLDIGAGDGLLARRFPQLEVLSVDLTTSGLAKVAGRAACSTAEQLAVRDASVDTVVLSEVLEHVVDPARALDECRRVLRPGGQLLLSVPTWPIARTEAARHRRSTGRRPTLQNLPEWDPNHERRYGVAELRSLVVGSGWRVVEEVPQFGELACLGLYWLEPIAHRLLGRSPALTPRLHRLDRLGRHSGVAMVLEPVIGP